MERRIGGLTVDVFPPESPKFKAPLILVHGVWADSRCWQPWATHWANLGWECWAINLKGRAGTENVGQLADLEFEECLDDLRSVIRACPQAPPLVGHGFGGLLAARAAEIESVAALVLLSAYLLNKRQARCRPLRLLGLKYFPLTMLRRPFRIQDRDVERYWGPKRQDPSHTPRRLAAVPESAHLVKDFLSLRVPFHLASLRCPILLVKGGRDAFTPGKGLQESKATRGSEILVYPDHHHWIMGEKDGESIVRDIHRWLIRSLGEEILLAEFPD